MYTYMYTTEVVLVLVVYYYISSNTDILFKY